MAVGLFNRADAPQTVAVKWPDLGMSGECEVRDLWRQKTLGVFKDEFEALVPAHGVVLVKLSRVEYAR
jgi:alpha-galactosidase